jgi:hypothetical protein
MSLINNYANFAQLVVVDGETGSISYAGEVKRQENEKNAVFVVSRIDLNHSQLFLLLIGHLGDDTKNPTLLASGFTPWESNGPRKILVYMWPIQVQTELNSPLQEEGAEPLVNYDADTGVFDLWPADYEMKWTLTTEGTKDPLAPLIAAQKIYAVAGTDAPIPETPAGVYGTMSTPPKKRRWRS